MSGIFIALCQLIFSVLLASEGDFFQPVVKYMSLSHIFVSVSFMSRPFHHAQLSHLRINLIFALLHVSAA